MRRHLLVTALSFAALLTPSKASALGAFASVPEGSVAVSQGRLALARGPSRSTLWVQLRLDAMAGSLVWVLPVPVGGWVDLGGSPFLDALEDATAPRCRPPADAAPQELSCVVPRQLEVSSSGDAEASAMPSQMAVVTDRAQLEKQLTALGADVSLAGPFDAVFAGKAKALVLRFDPADGASATAVVRVHGAGLSALPFELTRPWVQGPVPYTTWLIGEGRAKVDGVAEGRIAQSLLRWVTADKTTYASLLDAELSSSTPTLVLESSGPEPLGDTLVLPGLGAVAGLFDAYFRRAVDRGLVEGSATQLATQAEKLVLSGEVVSEGCPRGDLASPDGSACEPVATPLSPAPATDDLQFVFGGESSARWVTRFSGLLAAGSYGPSMVASFPGGRKEPVVRDPASSWAELCQSTSAPLPPSSGGAPSGGYTPLPDEQTPAETSARSSSSAVVVHDSSCSCSDSGKPTEEGSSSDSSCGSSGSSSEGDSCSSDEGGSGDDGGCDCGSGGSDGGGDGCDGGDSGGGGDGCDGGGSGGGDSCSSGGSSGCGKGSNDCAVGGSHKRRTKGVASRAMFVSCALALALRRRTRPRVARRPV